MHILMFHLISHFLTIFGSLDCFLKYLLKIENPSQIAFFVKDGPAHFNTFYKCWCKYDCPKLEKKALTFLEISIKENQPAAPISLSYYIFFLSNRKKGISSRKKNN
jgi:hypothetical protein